MSLSSIVRTLALVAAFVAGLYATWLVASAWAWQRSGLDRDATALDSDCDQCGLTVVLDDLGVVVLCLAA